MKTNSAVLRGLLNRVLKSGDVPYKAFYRALRKLDINNDAPAADKELSLLIGSLGILERDLGALSNEAKATSRRIVTGAR
jgi:hypothetical protein